MGAEEGLAAVVVVGTVSFWPSCGVEDHDEKGQVDYCPLDDVLIMLLQLLGHFVGLILVVLQVLPEDPAEQVHNQSH